MASQTEIMNLALYKLAQSIGIPSLNDDSKAADVMRRLWPTMRDVVLTDRVWPWALQSKPLQLVVEDGQPGWRYRYAYPADCLTAYAVTNASGLRTAGKLQRFANSDYVASVWGSGCFDFETSHGEQSTTINTSVEAALLVYVVRVEDVSRYPPQFVNALACRLAAEAAPPLIGEAGLQNKVQLLQEYQLALTHAGAHAMNESANQESYVTPSMAARL
jgi:hypothetical protein